ncbi:CHAT domain-containing protein [Ruminococcaceae bacterium YAD3003]|nr:CHAT domain-containing protein [Ruminococcaceae bacterium YAD3003]
MCVEKKYSELNTEDELSQNVSFYCYSYVIVFKGGDKTIESPIVFGTKNELKESANGEMHQFDPALANILPAISYCLHLPRFEWDTLNDFKPRINKAIGDIYHHIILLPSVMASQIQMYQPTLIIYDDNCEDFEIKQLQTINVEIDCVPVSALTDKLLTSHWKKLYEKRKLIEYEPIISLNNQHLLTEDQRLILPSLFFSRFYNDISLDYQLVHDMKDHTEKIVSDYWKRILWFETLARCSEASLIDNNTFNNEFEKTKTQSRINVVITLPGISRKQRELRGNSGDLSDMEAEVIRLMALRSAIAKRALLIELPLLSNSLYNQLNSLEVDLKAEIRSNNDSVIRRLRQLSVELSSQLSEEQLHLIKTANQLTVYSDFPFGLAIFDDDDVSLHSYQNVTYRPISPLANSLKFELLATEKIDFTRKVKVLFAECIIDNKENQYCRECSEKLLDYMNKLSKADGKIEVTYRETLSVSSLLSFLEENQDADVLYISAHGFYDYSNYKAGICVGEENWMAEDCFSVPPLVILSACHTNPRGTGCVSISDMFLRWGAVAVLGTYIPIDPQRNAYLMARLFSNISRSICNKLPYKDLLECWSGCTATNILVEMMSELDSFAKWLEKKNKSGITHIEDFEKRARSRTMIARKSYEDTCSIINEMLNEEGLSGKFSNLLSEHNFFPEMSFYQWEGKPESFILKHIII